ncbi:hypothetical protein [Streptomyces sp. AA1529]|uniref:hypothetical protein n=1 Tax=Streptomyces sp. AA1529 TaxID=1203257 RepID=UPI003D72EFE2
MSGDTGGGRPGLKESAKRQRPLKRARVGWPPALRQLKELLYEVYLAAGTPSLDEITEDIADSDGLDGAPSRDTVHRIISDGERPGQQADVVAVAWVLARRAAWDASDLTKRVRELWVHARMAQGAGRPIGDLRGDAQLLLDGGLGIHPALDTEGARDRFGILPAYLPRDHDARLKTVVETAVAGRSGIAVLVGGSSTGKTRALWEAVSAVPDDWRLWHPLTPTAPDAVLAALPEIAPKTVVWLNEAQHYLGPDPLGEQVAAGLRELLTDPMRAPVLVLGTLWPGHWDTLTTGDRHPGACALLGGHKIDVPKAFTPADLAALEATDNADPRLTQAFQHADDGQVTQHLAGVPYLMDRYHAAEGATRALIHAAMDARRLGAGLHIPLDWLADAALGYLSDTEYHALDDDWLSQTLTYVTTPCNGIPGILTPVNTSGPRNKRTRPQPDPPAQGPRYLLADYLDQHGRHHRAETIPPIDFWTAAAHHAHPTDLAALGNAAWSRGLYRDAAQLHKNATTHGNPYAAAHLVRHLHTVHPDDPRPAQWAAAHTSLGIPSAVVLLLEALWEAGAGEQASALVERAAAHTPLDDPFAVARLLEALRKAGTDAQVRAVAKQAAAHTPLGNPSAVVLLLEALREVGASEQASALVERAAAHTPLDDPLDVARLLEALRKAGADAQVRTLAEQAAAHTPLDDPFAVARLLGALREVGADAQVRAVAKRAAAHTPLNALDAVAELLGALWVVGASEQVRALAERAAAHTPLGNPSAVVLLLEALWKVGASEQASALVERAAAHTPLDDPLDVARLLEALREVGADAQVRAVAEQAAAHTPLDDPFDVARLLGALREVGADAQVRAVAEQAAAHTPLHGPFDVDLLLEALWKVGASEQASALVERAAAHTPLDDPSAVARLLEALRKAGADAQVRAVAKRAAAHTPLHGPFAVVLLLEALREVGAGEQASALVERAAAHTPLDDPFAVARLLEALRKAGADAQVRAVAEQAAAHTPLDDPFAVARLLGALREVGADAQVRAVAKRAAAHTPLDDPFDVAQLLEALREVGADAQVAVLLAREPAEHASLSAQFAVTRLLKALRQAGAHEQEAALAERLPAAGHFVLFIAFGGGEQFRLGREPDGSAAPSWTWDDLD